MGVSANAQKIVWNITNKCNFDCAYCYADSNPSKPIGLDTISVLRIAEDLNKSGAKFVSLIGGEPLLRSDMSQVLDALNNDIFIRLDTNGSLLRKKWTPAFENVNSFSIGLDGAPTTNQIFRQRTNDSINAIRFLIERGKSVNVPMLINSSNHRDIKASLSFIFSLGVNRVQVNKYIPPLGLKDRGLAMTNEEEDIALRQAYEFLDEYPDARGRLYFNGWKNQFFFENFRGPSSEPPRCRCGDLSAAIDYSGNFVPCAVLANDWAMPTLKEIYDVPNLLKTNIFDAYTSAPLFVDFRNSSGFMPSKCATCRFKFSCNHGCRGYALLSSGDIFSQVTNCTL